MPEVTWYCLAPAPIPAHVPALTGVSACTRPQTCMPRRLWDSTTFGHASEMLYHRQLHTTDMARRIIVNLNSCASLVTGACFFTLVYTPGLSPVNHAVHGRPQP